MLDFDVDAVDPVCMWKNWDHESNFLVQLLLPICLSILVSGHMISLPFLFCIIWIRSLAIMTAEVLRHWSDGREVNCAVYPALFA